MKSRILTKPRLFYGLIIAFMIIASWILGLLFNRLPFMMQISGYKETKHHEAIGEIVSGFDLNQKTFYHNKKKYNLGKIIPVFPLADGVKYHIVFLYSDDRECEAIIIVGGEIEHFNKKRARFILLKDSDKAENEILSMNEKCLKNFFIQHTGEKDCSIRLVRGLSNLPQYWGLNIFWEIKTRQKIYFLTMEKKLYIVEKSIPYHSSSKSMVTEKGFFKLEFIDKSRKKYTESPILRNARSVIKEIEAAQAIHGKRSKTE